MVSLFCRVLIVSKNIAHSDGSYALYWEPVNYNHSTLSSYRQANDLVRVGS